MRSRGARSNNRGADAGKIKCQAHTAARAPLSSTVRPHGELIVLSTIRIIRAYGKHDGSDRILALRQEAAKKPHGTALYVLANVLWEEGEIAEANQLAEGFLKENPTDFNMLVICLDFQIRANDPTAILELAHRVAAARKPSRLRRMGSIIAAPRTWSARLLGRGRRSRTWAEALDEWADWARDYVNCHSSALVGPNTSLERTRNG
jgi:hypothetical protein